MSWFIFLSSNISLGLVWNQPTFTLSTFYFMLPALQSQWIHYKSILLKKKKNPFFYSTNTHWVSALDQAHSERWDHLTQMVDVTNITDLCFNPEVIWNVLCRWFCKLCYRSYGTRHGKLCKSLTFICTSWPQIAFLPICILLHIIISSHKKSCIILTFHIEKLKHVLSDLIVVWLQIPVQMWVGGGEDGSG